jgi:hypothetical protein
MPILEVDAERKAALLPQIALVFRVFVIHKDDHLALADVSSSSWMLLSATWHSLDQYPYYGLSMSSLRPSSRTWALTIRVI